MIKSEQMAFGMALGALIGGVGAVLAAPQNGRENREVLRGKIQRIKEKVQRNHQINDEELPEAIASRDADYLH
jgi:gas vesicle protein